MKLDRGSEPVRLSGWTALVVGLSLSGLLLWSMGTEVRQIVGALSVMAITSIGGLEFARAKVTPYRG